MNNSHSYDVAIIGCGSTGIATAYYLARLHGIRHIALVDSGQPMAFTSAQSGENYRNWWPHPTMVDFTNRSINLMEDIAIESGNRINMTRRGYALVTRETDIGELIDQLYTGLGDSAADLVRIHEAGSAVSYQPPELPDWQSAPEGVDVLRNRDLIRRTFRGYADDVQSVVHIRRGGDISAQQMGMHMLAYLKEHGAVLVNGTVESICADDGFTLELRVNNGSESLSANKLVNAAGPFANAIASMLGTELPIHNTFQQKIAFDDQKRVVARNMPFSIDLDSQLIDWQDDERELLSADPLFKTFAEMMPGAIHCRPDGGDHGSWVKLGWAYNQAQSTPSRQLPLDDHFPEVVLRGAARLNPALKAYYGRLPSAMHHYGGWYTLTNENWPLIGPMCLDEAKSGAYMNCALSGFGTMAACAAGELCAAWVAGGELPSYASSFSLERYGNKMLMRQLNAGSKGIL